jgi:hypothetical protein
MVNKSTNINKTNINLSTQSIEHLCIQNGVIVSN